MNNNFYLIAKFKKDQSQIINFLRESLNTKSNRHYYIKGNNDNLILQELKLHDGFDVVFIVFNEKQSEFNPLELYLAYGNINGTNRLEYKVSNFTDSRLIIDNFIKNSGLDLKNDFMFNSYLSIETSKELMKHLKFALKESYIVNRMQYEDQKYEPNFHDNNLSDLSQKNEHCKRPIAINEIDKNRNEFQRDRERIVHAKASRRLVDKAQIFTASKGDHFRTRMTHTLEVSQIARGLSLSLNLNSDLTEAIALAHDIGHTPFGHQGERTLNSILRNELKVIPCGDKIDFGGFKHNFQGLRVLTYLEEKYFEYEGLDITYQVLEGVLKHTKGKVKNCEKCNMKSCSKKCFDVDEFLINADKEYLFLKYEFATTLEGQIVSIADEIAQRGHDLDDAFAAKDLTFDELLSCCEIRKMKPIRDILDKIKSDLNRMKNENKVFIDENSMMRSRLVSEVLAYFMKDIVSQSSTNISSYNTDNEFYNKYHRIDEELIKFSDEGQFILNYLETIISKKVINSFEVARFDDKAKMIVISLFKAYYNNPKLLPDGTLTRIYRDIRRVSKNVIDFRNGDPKLITDELYSICFSEPKMEDGDIDLANEYIIKRKILVRNIVDHISGMTDNYAINEYKLIYGNM